MREGGKKRREREQKFQISFEILKKINYANFEFVVVVVIVIVGGESLFLLIIFFFSRF